MTQKQSKPVEARAIGLGLTPKLIALLRANGIVLADATALERLRNMIADLEETQRRLLSERKSAPPAPIDTSAELLDGGLVPHILKDIDPTKPVKPRKPEGGA